MTFEEQDYRQFVELIYKHPEWRTELRQLVLTEELLALPQLVQRIAESQDRTEHLIQELAEVQKRTEQRVEELAEAQKRSEERLAGVEERVGRLEIAMAKLAEAQKRSEERLTRLEQTVAELAEAQKRSEERLTRLERVVEELAIAIKHLEQRVDELAEAQKQTTSQLGRLAEHISVSVEQEAADELCYLLRQKGYTLLEGPFTLPLNGESDVVCRVADPQGKSLTAVLEAKLRLGYNGVEDWAQQMRSSEFRQKIGEAGYPGPYLVYVYGLRIQPSAYEAVKRFGIGLLTDRGEHIEPQDLFP